MEPKWNKTENYLLPKAKGVKFLRKNGKEMKWKKEIKTKKKKKKEKTSRYVTK